MLFLRGGGGGVSKRGAPTVSCAGPLIRSERSRISSKGPWIWVPSFRVLSLV
jgi:hypothetical protein